MTRTHAVLATVTVALITAIISLGAPRAYADNPRERPCQPPSIVDAVRAALPTATEIRCPVLGPESEIVHGESRPLRSEADPVIAEAVLLDGRIATLEVMAADAVKADPSRPETAARAVRSITYAHSDLSGSSGKGMALLFWAFAAIMIVGAIFVISRRNLIAAVMGMVGSFLGIAAIYMMLYAQFLAVVQMLVYAGAIMVLFVFVVMILNRPEDEPVAPSGRAGQVIGGLAILYLVGRLIIMLTHVQPEHPDVAKNAPPPAPEQCIAWQKAEVPAGRDQAPPLICTQSERPDWGSIKAVGADLFGPGLFPFEAISILLLLAVVGAIAIARPLREDGDAEESRPEGGAV